MSKIKNKLPLNKAKSKKHLTEEERITIQTMLENQKSPYVIAQTLKKSASTIIREIKKHTKIIPATNDCQKQYNCKKKRICSYTHCYKLCKMCSSKDCHKICPDYVKGYCDRIANSPHVCNGCEFINNCGLEHQMYRASYAQNEYKAKLIDKRIGFDLTDDEIKRIDELVSPLIKAGHSPYAIVQELGSKLPCSAATLYRLLDKSLLSARNIDLQERVKRKPRKHNKITNKDAYALITETKKGHLWSDYLEYIRTHNVVAVQLDCVEGKKDDKAAILTLHWPREHMQLYFIIDRQDAKNVVQQLDIIENAIGLKLFKEMFPIILTDNGHEFTDVANMERSCTNPAEKRTTIFFCEPNRSDQKGSCERNHRLLRKIIPKGTSLENLTQWDCTLITNHVNSYVRKALGDICPYDIAMEVYEEDFFDLLGLERIPYNEIALTSKLIFHK